MTTNDPRSGTTQQRSIPPEFVEILKNLFNRIGNHTLPWVLASGLLVLFSAINVTWDGKSGLSVSFQPTGATTIFFALVWLPIVIQIYSIVGGSFKAAGFELSSQGVSQESLGWAFQKSEEVVDKASETTSPQDRATVAQYGQEFAQALVSRIPSQAERRKTVEDLGKQYKRVREQMSPGEERSNQMESIVGQIRALAPQAGFSSSEIKKYLESSDEGERIVGLSIMEALPSADYFEQILPLIQSGKPFQQYHALLAMLKIVQSSNLDQKQKEQLQSILENTSSIKKPKTDRDTIRVRLLSAL